MCGKISHNCPGYISTFYENDLEQLTFDKRTKSVSMKLTSTIPLALHLLTYSLINVLPVVTVSSVVVVCCGVTCGIKTQWGRHGSSGTRSRSLSSYFLKQLVVTFSAFLICLGRMLKRLHPLTFNEAQINN